MNETEATTLVSGTHSGLETTYFKLWMPYLYLRIEDRRRSHIFLPLNRNYKPLGQVTRDHVEYEHFVDTHAVVFSRDPLTFRNIWTNIRDGHFWLYDDSPKSRLDYFARLERLMLKNPIMLTAKLI